MGAADRVAIIPFGNRNRPGVKLLGGRPEWITIHETANTSPGANAEMHRRFVWNGGGPESVSFHYVVDDKESIQLLPDNEKAWHAGDGVNGGGNGRSVGIETCVNRDGDWNKTLQNLVKLVRNLMAMYNIPIERVVQHNYFSSYKKDCPHNMRLNNNRIWNWLIEQLREPAPQPQPQQPTYHYFPETGKTVAGDFLKFFNTNGGIKIFGFPITDEIDHTIWNGTTLKAQWFERARFERHPDEVKLGLVGREAYEATTITQ